MATVSMYGHMVDLEKYSTTLGERNFIEQIKMQLFEGNFSNRDNVRSPIQSGRESKLQHLER